MNFSKGESIARPVEILKGARAIAAFLRISQSEALGLERKGAPIERRNGIMRAEKAELWVWWKETP